MMVRFLFLAYSNLGGTELWTSDGTEAGTVRLKDIVSGPVGSNPASITVVNNKLYFTADDGINGNELWASDGAAAGTSLVQNFEPGSDSFQCLGIPVVYYRLKQMGAKNKFIYSSIIALPIDNKKNFAMLYPNPITNQINLSIALDKKEKINWQLVDNNGPVLRGGYYDLSAGSSAVSVDISNAGADVSNAIKRRVLATGK